MDRVRLDDGREMEVEPLAEGYLLHATQPGAAPRRAAGALSLRFTRRRHPSVLLDGTPVPVTLRPAELLTALALHPDGLTAERLALLLYGDDGNPTTVRGEILRLRALIGADVLRTRPYRLDATVDTDFGAVRRALRGRAGRPRRCGACAGPLLPRSDAPEIRELRDELVAGLRRAVLTADETDLLTDYASHPLGPDDLEVHERLLVRWPCTTPAARTSRPAATASSPPTPDPSRESARSTARVGTFNSASRQVLASESTIYGTCTQAPDLTVRTPEPADSRNPRARLLDRDALGQVAGLVDVAAQRHGRVVGQDLQRDRHAGSGPARLPTSARRSCGRPAPPAARGAPPRPPGRGGP